jgi:protein-S-isoprenylcysteine O-methyltransferase Ste14
MTVSNLFLIPLFMAFIGQSSVYLMRLTAPNFGRWLYRLADILALLSGAALLWSLAWALMSQAVRLDIISPLATLLGFGAVMLGAGLALWSAFTLGRQSFFGRPSDEVIDRGPYGGLRRPMGLGIYLVGIGAALISGKDSVWVWLGAFFVLSLLLFELEEWELRQRLPEASDYLDKTPRFIPRFR